MVAKGTYFDTSRPSLSRPVESVVYVEGADDAYFVDKILSDLKADVDRVEIISSGGKDKIPAALRALVLSSGFVRKTIKRIVVLRDADNDPAAASSDFVKACLAVGLPGPTAGNYVKMGDDRLIGLYLFPDCEKAGNLETLLLSANSDEPTHAIAAGCLDQAVKYYGDPELDRLPKRLAQIYLALQKEDCRGVGRAYGLGVFKESAEIANVRKFLANSLGIQHV